MMIEPTESESRRELIGFETLISIKSEMENIEKETWSREDNLKNAPHTSQRIAPTTGTRPIAESWRLSPIPH